MQEAEHEEFDKQELEEAIIVDLDPVVRPFQKRETPLTKLRIRQKHRPLILAIEIVLIVAIIGGAAWTWLGPMISATFPAIIPPPQAQTLFTYQGEGSGEIQINKELGLHWTKDHLSFLDTHGNLYVWTTGQAKLTTYQNFLTQQFNNQPFEWQWSPGGKYLIHTTIGNTLQIFDVVSGANVFSLTLSVPEVFPQNSSFLRWSMSGNDHYLAVKTEHGLLHIWDIDNKREILTLDDATSQKASLVNWSPEENKISVLFSPYQLQNNMQKPTSGTIDIWNVTTGVRMGDFNLPATTYSYWSPDNRHLATLDISTTGTHNLHVWDTFSGEENLKASLPNEIVSLNWLSDQRHATLLSKNELQLWDMETGKVLSKLALSSQGTSIISPNTTQVIFYNASQSWFIKNLITGRNLSLSKASNPIIASTIAWSPDNKYIGAVDSTGTALIWSTETGQMIRQAQVSEGIGEGGQIAWSPDSKKLAVYKEGESIAILQAIS